ncbi:MAG: T6SS effector BTH_I2691 family protein, partial [Pseudomonadota bacterium]
MIERHKDAAYRAKHMVCLDVQAWVGSKKHKGAADISQVDKLVAEYALTDAQGKSLAFTSGGFKSKASTAQALKDRVPTISPAGGLLLSIPDPAGIASDLGALMQHLHDSFVNAKGWRRELAVSTAISQIEAAVRASALDAEEAAADQLANESLSQPDIGMLFEGYRKKKLEQIEEIRTVSPAEAKRAEDKAWRKYTDKFDQKAAVAWKEQFDNQLKQWDEKQISPLALAHVAWMKSSILRHKMECTHDDTNADSGVAYAKTVSLCIAGTQDKGACFDLYTDWLAADVISKENLLLKALTLNLEKTQLTTEKQIKDVKDEAAKKQADATKKQKEAQDKNLASQIAGIEAL